MFLHNDDVDVEAAAAAAAQAGVRVVRVLTAAAVETAVAHSHARAGALLVGVCMRASRENDLLARGMLLRVCVAGDSVRGPVFENLPPTNLARRLAGTSAPSLDAILHKVTDELVAGGSACAGRDAWPPAARALADAATAAPVVIVDDVARVMRLGDRWATADALEGACVPTPHAVRVAAGVSAEAALAALVKTGLSFPVVVKPRTACGTASAHALAVVLRASGLATALTRAGCSDDNTTATAPTAAVDTACCDILIQQYVDHGGVLFKVYVAGSVVHVSRRPSVPDLGSSAGVGGLQPGSDATSTSKEDADASWLAFDSTAIARTASALAATAAAAAAARVWAAGPPAEPSAADLDGVVSALRRGLGVTLFGFDGVVDRQTGAVYGWGVESKERQSEKTPCCPFTPTPITHPTLTTKHRPLARCRRQLFPVHGRRAVPCCGGCCVCCGDAASRREKRCGRLIFFVGGGFPAPSLSLFHCSLNQTAWKFDKNQQQHQQTKPSLHTWPVAPSPPPPPPPPPPSAAACPHPAHEVSCL